LRISFGIFYLSKDERERKKGAWGIPQQGLFCRQTKSSLAQYIKSIIAKKISMKQILSLSYNEMISFFKALICYHYVITK
jgi:hypothetical protein